MSETIKTKIVFETTGVERPSKAGEFYLNGKEVVKATFDHDLSQLILTRKVYEVRTKSLWVTRDPTDNTFNITLNKYYDQEDYDIHNRASNIILHQLITGTEETVEVEITD